MRVRTFAMTLGLIIVLTACAPGGGPRSHGPARSGTLHLALGSGVTTVDATSGAVRYSLPDTIAAPGGRALFSTSQVPDGTRLEVRTGETGGPISSQLVAGSLVASVASPSGRLVALSDMPTHAGQWLAPTRDRTDLVVADVQRGSHREYQLDGNYAPEAFGFRDDRLFVIEYLPALAPDRYRVRQLDLASGQVLAVGGLTQKALPNNQTPPLVEEEMRGRGRTQVMAPDHTRLYTLYIHDEDHLHRRDYRELGGSGRPAAGVHAFVHVLSLIDGWAFCIDLPTPFGMGPAEAHTLALSPDGKRLAVVDASTGASIALADTETLQVVETHPKNAPNTYRAGTSTTLHAAADRTLYLGSGSELIALRRSGRVVYRRSVDAPILALAPSADPSRIIAASANQIAVVDAATGEVQATSVLTEPRLAGR
jgi:hypothetical protein